MPRTFSVSGGAIATILSGYVSDFYGVRLVFPFLAVLCAVAVVLLLRLAEPSPGPIIEGAEAG